uniref:C-type lectin domain-containing protein n=1 Tax=Panagrolaimus sp. PS1159 TaxID=55785 RepID=A0AC35EWK3_9BILA
MFLRSFLLIPFLVVSVSSSCPSSNTWKKNCYVFGTDKLGFSKAELACIQKGGHLASIHDFFENNVIGQAAEFAYHSVTDYWIGAYKNGKTWQWTDKSNFSNFTDWARGEPQNIAENGCAFMSYFNWNWKTENCATLKSYVCAVPI